jgi:hypothetical protein
MKFSVDDFKRLYAEMPDEELRSLSRQELTDLARQCYDAELARRGLQATPACRTMQPIAAVEEPEESALESEDPLDEAIERQEEEDLAPAALFASREEAKAARALLQSAEIPAFLEDDTLAAGGFRVLVAASDAAKAREVLRAGQTG